MATLADVFGQARALLGDHQGDTWTNATLFEHVKRAYRETLRVLRAEQLRYFQRTVILANVLPATTVLTSTTVPALPTDFLRPIEVYEKPNGSSAKYKGMEIAKGMLPDKDAATDRSIYDWRYGQFVTLASTGATDIKVLYEADLFNVAAGAPLIVTGATNADPIEVTTAVHGLTTGDVVYISGVTGNTGANGWWSISVTSTTKFTLDGAVGNGAWVSGGTVVPYSSLITFPIADIDNVIALLAASYAARSLEQSALQELYDTQGRAALDQIVKCERLAAVAKPSRMGQV